MKDLTAPINRKVLILENVDEVEDTNNLSPDGRFERNRVVPQVPFSPKAGDMKKHKAINEFLDSKLDTLGMYPLASDYDAEQEL